MRRHANETVTQNTLVVWLDDQANNDQHHIVHKLERLMNQVQLCTDHNFFLYQVNTTINKELFVIIPGYVGQYVVPMIHDKKNLNSIYILCGDKAKHEKWAKQWANIKGVFTDISSIHEALKETVRQREENTVEITLTKVTHRISDERDWEPLENFREALLAIESNDEYFKDFIAHYRTEFVDDEHELNNIHQLEHNYHSQSPVWWYMSSNSLYSMLNKALRTVDIDAMVNMGFFLRDIHKQIQKLQLEQFSDQSANDIFKAYRGQGLSKEKLKRLIQNEKGLIIFHNFLSTSKDYKVSLDLAHQATVSTDMIGVLFTITIDPHKSIACCASIGQVSSLHDDNEILFSMYTAFRIIDVESINDSKRLYEVHLTPLSGNDPDLHKLTYRRQLSAPILFSELTSWNRLGRVLSNMRCYQKAEELYNVQLSRTTNDTDKGHIYQELAWNKCQEGKFDLAIEFYEKAVDMYQSMHPPNQLGLAEALLNIGHVYTRQNNYTKAIAYPQEAIAI
ncbi:unnamed protein product, partial [Adineta ricciae]